MIRPEYQSFELQFCKGPVDISRAQIRAVAPDRDNFVVAKRGDFFDGVFQPRREVMAVLPMNARLHRMNPCREVKR